METKIWQKKLEIATKDFNELYNDSTGRGLSFISARCLSKASINKLNRYRNKVGNLAEDVCLLKRAVKMENKEPFTIMEIERARLDIKPSPPEIKVWSCMPIIQAAEIIRKTFTYKYKSAIKNDIAIDFNTINEMIFIVTPQNRIIQKSKN